MEIINESTWDNN